MLGYHPLVYFWIAEYNDGIALPQFDPESGRENGFADVDHSKLKHFGWYPFTPELEKKISEASVSHVFLEYVMVSFDGFSRIIRVDNCSA